MSRSCSGVSTIVVLFTPLPGSNHPSAPLTTTGNMAYSRNASTSGRDCEKTASGQGTPSCLHSWYSPFLLATVRGRAAGGRGNTNHSSRAAACSATRIAARSSVVSRDFEASVEGLYFVSLVAANHFGPVMRFVYGADFAARRLVKHSLRQRAMASAQGRGPRRVEGAGYSALARRKSLVTAPAGAIGRLVIGVQHGISERVVGRIG
jgi:hypothetical protein